ncbi:MAG: ATP-binding protein [Acidimicrobiia bacterium]|nr:MAG: ATP-binding protein [Acidimicrobiia bacterium]
MSTRRLQSRIGRAALPIGAAFFVFAAGAGIAAAARLPVWAILSGVIATLIVAPAWVLAATWVERSRNEETIAHLAHELRNPIASVVGTADVLLDPTADLDDDERKELLALAQADARYMHGLVANLHGAARVERNESAPTPEPVDLAETTHRALTRFPSVDARAFSPTAPTWVTADPDLLFQVLLNLLQNTARYAPEGMVEIEFEPQAGQVSLYISDEGPGIPRRLRHRVFDGGASRSGLGLGLALSRRIARAMGGELEIVEPRRTGATFRLRLPAATPGVTRASNGEGWDAAMLSPRGRLLVDMADALSGRSMDRTLAGLQRLFKNLLGATGMLLMIPRAEGGFGRLGTAGGGSAADTPIEIPLAQQALEKKSPITAVAGDSPTPVSLPGLDGVAQMFLPVLDGEGAVAVLALSWDRAESVPGDRGRVVAEALARLAAVAIDRSTLARDIAFERHLRSSVMEALPIAIAVFVGDPPRVVAWNRRERELLGISDDTERPSDLDASQQRFDVRFADGNPLTVDNAPVTQAIRSGRSAGPFVLWIRRADGTQVLTRSYCAPFHDDHGIVAGAVVTSEELPGDTVEDPPRGPRSVHPVSPIPPATGSDGGL